MLAFGYLEHIEMPVTEVELYFFDLKVSIPFSQSKRFDQISSLMTMYGRQAKLNVNLGYSISIEELLTR